MRLRKGWFLCGNLTNNQTKYFKYIPQIQTDIRIWGNDLHRNRSKYQFFEPKVQHIAYAARHNFSVVLLRSFEAYIIVYEKRSKLHFKKIELFCSRKYFGTRLFYI